MPHKNAKIFSLPLTPAQDTILENIAGKGNKAAYIRALIAAECKRQGVEWSEDLIPRGGYARKSTP